MLSGADLSELLIVAACATSFAVWGLGAIALLAASRLERPDSRDCLLASLSAVAGTVLLFYGTISAFAEAIILALADPRPSFMRAVSPPWSAALILPAGLSLLHLRRQEPLLYRAIEYGSALAAVAAIIAAPHTASLYKVVAGLAACLLLARALDRLTARHSRMARQPNQPAPEARPRVIVHDFTPPEIVLIPRTDLHRASRQAR